MELVVNGENRRFNQVVTLQDLLDTLELDGRLAVELNKEIIPRSHYRTLKLNSGDKIEIVRAIGGG